MPVNFDKKFGTDRKCETCVGTLGKYQRRFCSESCRSKCKLTHEAVRKTCRTPAHRKEMRTLQYGNTNGRGNKGLRRTPDQKARISAGMRGYKLTPDERAEKSRLLKHKILEGHFVPHPNPNRGNICRYHGYTLRSALELRVAEALDDLGVKWIYEAYRFQYENDTGTHTYIPDFYLPELNLFLEVKPAPLVKLAASLKLKLGAVRKAGFRIRVCTGKHLKRFRRYLGIV